MRACGPSTSVGWRLTALRLTTIEECSIPIEIGKLSAIGYRPSAISYQPAISCPDALLSRDNRLYEGVCSHLRRS